MVEIKFKNMKVNEEGDTVKILGDCFGGDIKIELSILQLAKIFGTDRHIAQEVENDFGSREYVKKFPHIDLWNNEVKFNYVFVESDKWSSEEFLEKFSEKDNGSIMIYAEDIVGWDNEGIRIGFPIDLYNKLLGKKDFEIFVTPFSVKFEVK